MEISRYMLPLTLSLLCLMCKGNSQPEYNDENLECIVSFNEKLDDVTPTEFAVKNFKNYFDNRGVQQPLLKDREKVLESKTIIFQQSLSLYIKDVYNSRLYTDALSRDASHVIQFLELSNDMSLTIDLVYVCMRLFYNKIKSCEMIEDTVLLQLLSSMPQLLERYFTPALEPERTYDVSMITRQFESLIITKFTNHLPDFKQNPHLFISTLSQDLAASFQQAIAQMDRKNHNNEIRERLRSVIIRFYDTALSKTLWNTKAHDTIWKSFVSIAEGLQQLGASGVIEHMDDLDDLLWTLSNRFYFYLDLAGAMLPTTFYAEVEKDLTEKSVFFLEFKEQDEGITSKKEWLAEYLMQAKSKAIAFEKQGIISTPMVF